MGSAWTEKEINHLLGRTAFGATDADIEASLSLGKEAAVRRLVDGLPLQAPSRTIAPIEQVQLDGKALVPGKLQDEQAYWLYRILQSDTPLIEKMALFWHGHFATSYAKVQKVSLMVRQIEQFRRLGLGSFGDLLLAVGTDPAMMIWLDTERNVKGSPNENYAREVMELFTLGRGHYTETDVKEAARSLTGWDYEEDKDQAVFRPERHDNTLKTVLGSQGNWDERDVSDIILKQPALYDYLSLKLLQAFACENPSPSWRTRIAARLHQSLQIKDALYEIFISDEFYEETCLRALVKSPVEYVAALARTLLIPLTRQMADALPGMGQELFAPPDVAGWRGGRDWLATDYLLARFQHAERMVRLVQREWFLADRSKPTAAVPIQERLQLWSRKLRIAPLSQAAIEELAAFSRESLVLTDAVMRQLLLMMIMCPENQLK
ncbi:DUF1800 domain-containing protein [Paenibacillus aestuarii]|uniref:DUF1800 family protein n=1 Tax=Paenibacillus aestuarii TaxID=516965 RepID=A0ABW0K036_9BACL|nr:DUF1800 domain-containing protein [Paenibacillus aestuarii]